MKNSINDLIKNIRKDKEQIADMDENSVEYKMKHKAIREMEKQKRGMLNKQTGIQK